MVRARWPDVIIVLALVLLATTGVWALWGEQLASLWHPDQGAGAAQFDRPML